MKNIKYLVITLIMVVSLSLAGLYYDVAARSPYATAPGLGTAASYSVLGFSEVTNSGPTTLSRGIGVWSGTSISGLAQITVGGATNQGNSAAQQAQADASAAVGNISGQANSGGSLGALDSLTLAPGVYDMGAGSLGGGVLTLNGEGIYIFRASSSLTSSGSVKLINGSRACDVYWYVPTRATLSGGSFVGTIIAGTGITFGTGVHLNGRALAIGGNVTLLSNSITGPSCGPNSNLPDNPQPEFSATPTLVSAVSGLPNTGGAPLQSESSPWVIFLMIGGFSSLVLVAVLLANRMNHRLEK
jgi:hypothetical protein